jgi:hypothetical protein
MKKHLLHVVLTLLLVLPVAPALNAQTKREHKEPDTELGKIMGKVGRNWRTLKKQVDDPASNASSLELVAAIKTNLEQGLKLAPARAADVPAADREKYIESFRQELKEFIGLTDQLAAAFKANDNAAASALLKKMGAEQREEHKKFRRPDE